ncbi:MFS domain-containing protein [Mycena sanguinolenta]|uniref:MFS domain-containing protein n=1 Tax=Mycena sanguinolenta TaxID=230812 RepID=A0A8H7DHB1_9AGAR|nr:MFS domain-containing protein [Mycena sanguinolenta]
MASRIPIRPPRTVGAENENTRPTQAPSRAKVLGRSAPLASLSKRAPVAGATNENAARATKRLNQAPLRGTSNLQAGVKKAGASSDAAGSSVLAAKSARVAELEAVGSAKRKRQALQELAVRKNVSAGADGAISDHRKILALPKKSAASVTQRAPLASHANQLQEAAERMSDAARLPGRRSLIPVRQQRENDDSTVDLDVDDDAEPSAKRQRTSSIGPEDIPSEAEIAGELVVHEDDEEDAVAYSADWEDLDAADHDDPMMASEYVADIQRYLKELEVDSFIFPFDLSHLIDILQLTTLPSPNYMSSQPTLTWSMRALLNDWLLQVHGRFHLLPETLFLCTHLLDRFLCLRVASPSKLQLLGLACLLIASKFEETVSPAIVNFTAISGDAFTAAEMRDAERHVLKTLEWDVSWMGPMHWLRRVSKADGYNPQTRQLGKYLAELILVEEKLVSTPPSLLAAAAMWLSRLVLGVGEWVGARSSESAHDGSSVDDAHEGTASGPKATVFTLWTPTLAHYATYTERELLPTAAHMLRYVLKPIVHESFYKKWAGKRNMKASVYMREWALARWAEGSKVDLVKDLPALKREIVVKARKEAEAERQREAAVELEAAAVEGGEDEW